MRVLRGISSKISLRHSSSVKVQARRYVPYVPPSLTLSENRLEQFVQAELAYFAQMESKPVKLGQIIKASTPQQVADLIHNTLTVGYATRVKNLENLPHFTDIDELLQVKEILVASFRNLRLVQDSNLEHLEEALIDLRKRHTPITNMMGAGIQKLKDLGHMTEREANVWMNSFLSGRVGTQLLTQHFLTMHQEAVKGGWTSTSEPTDAIHEIEAGMTGIVDRSCDPYQIAHQAADKVKIEVAAQGSAVEIEVLRAYDVERVSHEERIEFSFVPRYLQFMLEELLKNSAMAVINKRAKGGVDPSLEKIRVVVVGDPGKVRIQISDRGGGIPSAYQKEIWSYGWSTKEFDPNRMKETEASPLAGFGVGLPLTRLYAEYLGGSLAVMPLPTRGVDVFLDLIRITTDDSAMDNTDDNTTTLASSGTILNVASDDSVKARQAFQRESPIQSQGDTATASVPPGTPVHQQYSFKDIISTVMGSSSDDGRRRNAQLDALLVSLVDRILATRNTPLEEKLGKIEDGVKDGLDNINSKLALQDQIRHQKLSIQTRKIEELSARLETLSAKVDRLGNEGDEGNSTNPSYVKKILRKIKD